MAMLALYGILVVVMLVGVVGRADSLKKRK